MRAAPAAHFVPPFQQLRYLLKDHAFGPCLRTTQTTSSFFATDKDFLMIDQTEFRLFAQKVLIRRAASQGQALRVCQKKSPHLRCAPGSIFFGKALSITPAPSGEVA
ncbi:hypothetical protein AB6735_24240 [Mucilaginibacter sp. RCC_168]|uniref:hypothetical protein n=1 Tax=Mucilaginibacter sp. RCC_168 TaxID=3239221 RepID=UPI0035251CFA